MGCTKIKVGTVGVIVCTRGRYIAKCQVCKKRPHTKLCDFPRGDGRTCDKKLCDGCAVVVNKEPDYCPEHK